MTNDSRRRFLTGGAMAAVGAIASAVAPRAAEAATPSLQGCSLPPPLGNVSYAPNDDLARAIVKAWSDTGYRNRLLSYGPGVPVADYTKPDYESTSLALQEVDVHILQPIVMTVAQYAGFNTFIQGGGKAPPGVLFVLPDPLGSQATLSTARVAMVVTCNGM
jgi:hypothetical protein